MGALYRAKEADMQNEIADQISDAVLDALLEQNPYSRVAAYDTVAPPDKMLKPLAKKLEEKNAPVTYKTIKSNHSFVGQRMKLTGIVGEWLERIIV